MNVQGGKEGCVNQPMTEDPERGDLKLPWQRVVQSCQGLQITVTEAGCQYTLAKCIIGNLDHGVSGLDVQGVVRFKNDKRNSCISK